MDAVAITFIMFGKIYFWGRNSPCPIHIYIGAKVGRESTIWSSLWLEAAQPGVIKAPAVTYGAQGASLLCWDSKR
jgi:hypothetical protein